EALIAHELAHIRRYDYLVNLLQSIVETLLFYHPAVWWLSRRVRTEREHCCDDLAVATTGDVLLYARALTTLETLRRRTGVSLVSMPAFQTYYNPRMERDLRKLIGSLRAHNAPAIGFVGENVLYKNGQLDEERVQLLRTWLDAGYELGTQTFSHPSLYETPLY